MIPRSSTARRVNALLKLVLKGIIPYIRRIIIQTFMLTGLLLVSNQYTLGQLKIVPLGNSITQGNIATQGANTYRRNLWNKLNNAGYNVNFVGSLDTDNKGRTFPDASFDHDHEGHWGWRADEILADLVGWLTGYTPDVALIHLGSNDAIQGNTVNSTLDEIENIIGVLRDDNSRITIFLAQILPLENADWNAKVEGINEGLNILASNLDEAQSRIILVDQNSGWSIADHTYDGVHPNPAGEERMAQRWFNAFDAFYSSGNEAPEITSQYTLSVNEDLPLTLSVSDFTVSDPDSDPGDMSLTVYEGNHYSVNGTTITPEENWHGTLSIQVTVSDGDSESEPYDALVTVNSVNDAPVITGQSELVVPEDHTIELTLSHFTVNDVDHPSGPFSLIVQSGSNYSNEGNRITPSRDYAGVLSIPVVVSDGSAASNPFNAMVTVTGVNDPPAISEQSALSVDEDQQLTLLLSDFTISDPDTDPGDMSLSISGGSHYMVNGTIITPDENWHGTLIIQVTVNDGVSDSDPFDATVTVNPINDAPVVADIPDQTINKGERFEIVNLGMYVEDDETSDSLITWSVVGASKLSVTIIDQEAAISPLDDNWTGTETIFFIATDGDSGGSLSSSDKVQFTINTPVSIRIPDMESIGLYPNPSDGEFIIDTFGEPRDLNIVIYDSQGRIIKHGKYKNVSRLRNNLYAYPSGIYHIEVISEENISVMKFLKE
ncbi:MAG: tandem-95 repeat protein [Bacteroidota bacterium]